MLSWVDGQPAAQVSLLDRGLAYGDGLFETIAVQQGQPTLFEAHLQRLAHGCQRLQLPIDWPLLRAELLGFCAQVGDGVAKLIVTRGDGLRGYAFVPSPARRILIASATPDYPAEYRQQGVELFDCQTRLSEQPLLAALKHLNRLEQVLARAEWHDPRFAEGLLQDAQGRVIEGVFSNLLWITKGVLYTPALNRCGVAGVMRGQLLAQAQAWGWRCEEGDFALSALLSADEVLLCNSLYGVWPVRGFQTRRWPVGPLTRKLQAFARGLTDV